jgi:pimeloyl-ACP methyl ester carboxylesterase
MYAAGNAERYRDVIGKTVTAASGISDEGMTAVLNGMMARPSRLEIMENGKVPCLWILGSGDNYIQCETIRRRVRLPANAELLILENSGHMGFIEEEDITLEALAGFADRHV